MIQRSMATDIEARSGVIVGGVWGLQAGAYVNFPQSRLFSIQTGALLHTAERDGIFESISVNIPVCASFHLPASDKVNVRLNGGGYVGTTDYLNLGVTGEAGVEVKRFYVGMNCFYNCINQNDLQLGLSVSYKFSL